MIEIGALYEHRLADYVVVGYIPDLSKKHVCGRCGRTGVRNVYTLKSTTGSIVKVGKKCAGFMTGQLRLVEAMDEEINSLIHKHEQFCRHRDWKDASVRMTDLNKKGNRIWRSRSLIRYDGYIVNISENNYGKYTVRVDGQFYPEIHKNEDDAKKWFFYHYGKLRMESMIYHYYKNGQEDC
jgi:hypothetical protein